MIGRSFGHSWIGIDITPLAVHLVQVFVIFGQYRLNYFASAFLQPAAVINDQIQDVVSISTAIKSLLPKFSLFEKISVVLAIPDSFLSTTTIQVNKNLPEQEIESLALLEASKQLNLPLTEINFDFEPVDNIQSDSSMISLRVTSCPRELLKQRLKIIRGAGLSVSVVEPMSFAITRMISHCFKTSQNEKWLRIMGVIQVNVSFVRLYIVEQGSVIFEQEKTHEDFFKENNQNYFWNDILRVKKQNSIIYNHNSCVINDSTDPIITNNIQDYIAWVVLQIKSLLALFFISSRRSETKPDQFFLIGDLANLPFLLKELKTSLSINVKRANLGDDIQISKRIKQKGHLNNFSDSFIALGLALKTLDV